MPRELKAQVGDRVKVLIMGKNFIATVVKVEPEATYPYTIEWVARHRLGVGNFEIEVIETEVRNV